jgi:hypothetical protein
MRPIRITIAGVGNCYDMDRAAETRRVRKNRFRSFDEFKVAHASNGAEIFGAIHEGCCADHRVRVEISRLARLHEAEGDERSDVLKKADTLSYSQHNHPLHLTRNGWMETKRRAMRGFARLSPELRQIVGQLCFESEDSNALLQEVVVSGVENS